jgi:hypothetical protein
VNTLIIENVRFLGVLSVDYFGQIQLYNTSITRFCISENFISFRSALETLSYSIYINEKGKKSLDTECAKQNDPPTTPQHIYLDDYSHSLTSPVYRKSASVINFEP